ncbi:MAG: uncharacterized protein KVP18_001548 [Porospora cf. gigantea A]|nr:MAG: hypothetical protein KVP18_001548 [Porospora cf. gigantea A]
MNVIALLCTAVYAEAALFNAQEPGLRPHDFPVKSHLVNSIPSLSNIDIYPLLIVNANGAVTSEMSEGMRKHVDRRGSLLVLEEGEPVQCAGLQSDLGVIAAPLTATELSSGAFAGNRISLVKCGMVDVAEGTDNGFSRTVRTSKAVMDTALGAALLSWVKRETFVVGATWVLDWPNNGDVPSTEPYYPSSQFHVQFSSWLDGVPSCIRTTYWTLRRMEQTLSGLTTCKDGVHTIRVRLPSSHGVYRLVTSVGSSITNHHRLELLVVVRPHNVWFGFDKQHIHFYICIALMIAGLTFAGVHSQAMRRSQKDE